MKDPLHGDSQNGFAIPNPTAETFARSRFCVDTVRASKTGLALEGGHRYHGGIEIVAGYVKTEAAVKVFRMFVLNDDIDVDPFFGDQRKLPWKGSVRLPIPPGR